MNKKKVIPLALAFFMIIGTASATVLSVSEIDYESNAEFFDGNLVAIEMVADDSTEKIQVDNVPANSITDQITGTTEQDIQIEATELDKYVEYSISNTDGEAINKWNAVNKRGFNSKQKALDWASANCDQEPFYHNSYLTLTLYKHEIFCWQQGEKLAEAGEFREDGTSPRSQFEVKYELSVDGQPTETVTLSSSDIGKGTTSDLGSQAKIEWLGNYDLTTSPEGTSSGAMAAQSDEFSSGWRVISEDDYNTYDDFVEFTMNERLKDWKEGERSESMIENEVNDYALEAASEHTSHRLSEGRITDAGINDGTLQYTPDAELFHPSFMLYVNAGTEASDAITIQKSAGVPEILSVSGDDNVGEVGSGTIELVAKNAGDKAGDFEARISSCTEGFDFDDTPRERSIPSGETSEFSFQVSFQGGDGTQDVNGACQLELEETVSGEVATANAELVGKQESQCNAEHPYPTVQNGNEVIAECQNKEEVIIETCEGDETANFNNGEWTCTENEDKECDGWFGTCFTPLEDVSDALSGGLGFVQTISLMLGVIVTFAASLFTFGFSYRTVFDTFMLDEVTKDFGVAQNLVRLGFALIPTALVGYLVYTVASNIWVQLITLLAVIVAGYLYVQFGGALKSLT